MAGADITALRAQAIWREALASDEKCWQAQADPVAAFHAILDHALDAGAVDSSLIDRLSHTPVADLVTYRRRREVWANIGDIGFSGLLAATAEGWLRHAARVGVPFVPEGPLQTAILASDKVEATLNGLDRPPLANAIGIVAALNEYGEQGFLRLIENVFLRTTALGTVEAQRIGSLVLERRWRAVAAALVAQCERGRVDVTPALRVCYDMLNVWDRFRLRLTPVSEVEKWEGLLELASELYPAGPDDGGLWERAGGNDADLPSKGDGRTRWRRAVRNIRNGRGPTPLVLLTRMSEDFPNNERIPNLADERLFGAGARRDAEKR